MERLARVGLLLLGQGLADKVASELGPEQQEGPCHAEVSGGQRSRTATAETSPMALKTEEGLCNGRTGVASGVGQRREERATEASAPWGGVGILF